WISLSSVPVIAQQSARSLRGSQKRPDAGGVRSRQTRSADIAGSRTQELVTLAVVLAAAVVFWRWVSGKIHQWKEQDRRNTADARTDDEASDLEAGGEDDSVNPAGSDIEPAGAADFLSASGDDVESRRSDVDSGSWGVWSRGESERSTCSTWMTARTHHNPDDADSGTLGWAEMAAAVAEAGYLPSDRSVSRNRPEEASTGTNSLAMSKEPRRRSTRSEFDVRHHGSSSGKSSSNNSVYSQHRKSNGDWDSNDDGNDDELDGHSIFHDVLEDALHRARMTTGEREGGLERPVANGDLERYSGSGDGEAARGASTGGSRGGSSLSTITADGYEPMEGHEEEKEEEGDGNVGDHIAPSSHGSMPELEKVNEPEPHLAPTRMDRLIEIFSNAPLMSTAVRDIYIASHCDLDLSASDSNGDLTRERVIGTGYYGRVSRVYHASLGERLALKELSEVMP
ncbi:unnamed protein product, partial [Ectocarpus sp. 12 AP-2014]